MDIYLFPCSLCLINSYILINTHLVINIILANPGRNPRILSGFDHFFHYPKDSLQNLGNVVTAL